MSWPRFIILLIIAVGGIPKINLSDLKPKKTEVNHHEEVAHKNKPVHAQAMEKLEYSVDELKSDDSTRPARSREFSDVADLRVDADAELRAEEASISSEVLTAAVQTSVSDVDLPGEETESKTTRISYDQSTTSLEVQEASPEALEALKIMVTSEANAALAEAAQLGAIDMMVDWFTPVWNARHAEEEWLDLVKPNINFLYSPKCSEVGYINFIYRSSSFEMRESLRNFVQETLPRHIKFSNKVNEPIFKWLSRNFIIPFEPRPSGMSTPHPPKLIRIYFPVGRPCTEDSADCAMELKKILEEAKHYKDLIIGDYPDTSEMQGVKFLSALDWLNDCRSSHHSPWQWVVKVEPMILANVPNIAYYLRMQDAEFLKKFAKNDDDPSKIMTDTLPLKDYGDKLVNSLPWWAGRTMDNIPVVKFPVDHPNAEPNFPGDVYPSYTSKRFTVLNRRVVAELVPRYKQAGLIYRNEDSMLATILEDMNKEYEMQVRPFLLHGVSVVNVPETIGLLCGKKYVGAEYLDRPKNAIVVDSLLQCDCSTWLSYAAKDATDRREVARDLVQTCPFSDRFFAGHVFWLKK